MGTEQPSLTNGPPASRRGWARAQRGPTEADGTPAARIPLSTNRAQKSKQQREDSAYSNEETADGCARETPKNLWGGFLIDAPGAARARPEYVAGPTFCGIRRRIGPNGHCSDRGYCCKNLTKVLLHSLIKSARSEYVRALSGPVTIISCHQYDRSRR